MIFFHDLPKVFALIRGSFSTAIRQRGELIGKNCFFLILLYIFSQLWRVSLGSDDGITAAQGVWYLAGADWVLIAAPLMHARFEEDLRSGNVVYSLVRPLSWTLSRVAEGIGELFAKLIGTLPAAIGGAWLLAGTPNPEVLWMLLLGPIAGVLFVLMAATIGLLAVWIHEVGPLRFILMKFMMLFGGLIVPLTFYPDWFREIAEWTPFAHIIFGVGRVAFDEGASVALLEFAHLLAWTMLCSAILYWINRRAMRAVQADGG